MTGELIVKKYFQSEDWEKRYSIHSINFKYIRDYTGLNFKEIKALPFYEFLLYYRDSWIYTHKQSEQGREFLKELSEMTQAEPDYQALRKIVKHEIV